MTRIRGRAAKGRRDEGILREGVERLTYCASMLWEAAVSGVTARRSVRESVEECEGLGREKYEERGGREGRRGGSSHAQLVQGRKVLSSGYMKEDK